VVKHIDPEGIEMQTIQKHVNFAGKDVLEIGCGDGRLTFKYAEMAKRVVALDPDAERIKLAEANNPKQLSGKLEFRVGNGEELSFPEDSFDIVFFTYSLCCINPSSMMKALKEAWRVLKPEGSLASIQPSLLQPFKSGVVAYILTKKFGDEEEDKFRQARFALKSMALLEKKLVLVAEETCTVNYCYDTSEEALEDVVRKQKEQYDCLSMPEKQEIRKIIDQWASNQGITLRENEVVSFFSKAYPVMTE
jgi:ubiquinone/menaquinone biosynthesis C-methylase UbiE